MNYLNGQFALAIWDARQQALFLARDRVGIHPLYYTRSGTALVFGSEIKTLLAYPGVQAQLDPVALDQVFTCWSPQSPRTAFQGIFEIPPGSYLLAQRGVFEIKRYWQLSYPDIQDHPESQLRSKPLQEYVEELRGLLVDATQIRLRADVPVGAYLSGGVDSSTIAAIIRKYTGNRLDTFSISFSDQEFDESSYQRRMAQYLGTDHQVVYASHADIGRIFPEVIWHSEVPITRTAPAPMFLLSKLVNDHHYKVILTGEGADEFLAGYDIFKEAKIRRFWARQPDLRLRPLLLRCVHPHIKDLTNTGSAYMEAFFKEGMLDLDNPFYSHEIRWKTTSRTKRFFSEGLAEQINDYPRQELPLPEDFKRWHSLSQAQYIEITSFLSTYLLSSQGDRMTMAHSVEGRPPFLDVRLMEFCNSLPPDLKLKGMTEKYLLKQVARQWLPDEIWQRNKQPYRAPIHRSFFNEATPDYIPDLLSEKWLAQAGYFKPEAVAQMVDKIQRGQRLSETDDMALAGIISTQLVYHSFVADFRLSPPVADYEDLKVCRGRITQGATHGI